MFIPTWLLLLLALSLPFDGWKDGIQSASKTATASSFGVIKGILYAITWPLWALGSLIPDCIVDLDIRII